MTKIRIGLLLLPLLLCLSVPARAQETIIKLGTLAPSGSTWHTLLKEMGQKWSEASGGKVKLRIYPGGVVGNEGDMVKKMRINQLQAAALTTVGLHDVAPDPQAMDLPMMIGSFSELDYVREHIGPRLEKLLESKGYIVLSWSDVGFVRFFSTRKFATLADLQKEGKVFCWDGDPASADAWRAAGFHPVVMSSTDVVPSLQTGLIDTVAMAPLYAFTSRIFERAKYMIDPPWSTLSGAMIVRKDVWEKVPADVRPRLLEVAHEYGKKISAEVRRMDDEALQTMKQQGLQVVHADPSAMRAAAAAAYKVIRGRVVPAATFDEMQKLAEEARKHGGK
jgi:TRAP-type C4-dicarboxylate transport system substrate-binding protein